jgi:hypothetical protein
LTLFYPEALIPEEIFDFKNFPSLIRPRILLKDFSVTWKKSFSLSKKGIHTGVFLKTILFTPLLVGGTEKVRGTP